MVGLTGGIGAGKSTVAAMLAAAGRGRRSTPTRSRVRWSSPARRRWPSSSSGSVPRSCGRRLARPARARRGGVRRRRDPQGARGDHAPGDRRGVPAAGRRSAARRGRRARRAAARGVEAGLRVRGRDRRGGAARDAARPARGAGRAARRRRAGASALQATDEERRKVATWVVDNAGDLAHLEHRSTTSGPSSNAAPSEAAGRRIGDVTVSPHRYSRPVPDFELVTDLEPAGDQPEAIAALGRGPRRAATGSRRCWASPARARASRSPT